MTTKLDKTQSSPVQPVRPAEAQPVTPPAPAPAQANLAVGDGFGAKAAPAAPNRLLGLAADPESVRTRGSSSRGWVAVSSHDDDPFVDGPSLERMGKGDFVLGPDGKPTGLVGPKVKIETEGIIYRQNEQGQFQPFANNPWPEAKPNRNGNFVFQDEPRFPVHLIERGEDGKPKLDENGLQVWKPKELFLGKTTTFEAVTAASNAVEGWAGRKLPWGDGGQMVVNTQAFVGFNAFFSPSARALFFGVVPYRMPGETDIKMFEMASSWEVSAHEAGHALHNELKPNRGPTDKGYRTWGESFGDQVAMFTSLKDRDRARALLAEVKGDLNKTNSLTRIGEVLASLIGEGTGIRDAFQNKTVENTSDEVHDRSEVLTGAAYKVFQRVYRDFRAQGYKELDALQKSGELMGKLMVRVADHTPENSMSFADVAKGYLKADREYFGGKFGAVWADQFKSRGLLDDAALAAFEAHEAQLPKLTLAERTPEAAQALLDANLDTLAGAGFGLKLQSHHVDADGRQVIRVQLTEGRGPDATALENHGVMVIRPDGTLADYQGPLPAGLGNAEAHQLLAEARKAGLHQQGTLGLRPKEEGDGFTVVVEKAAGDAKLSPYILRYSLEQPQGVRREWAHLEREDKHLESLLPRGARILTADELAAA